jgi:hypothetical protein
MERTVRKRLDELGVDIIHEIASRENEFRELMRFRPDKLADEFSSETLQFFETNEQLNRLKKINSEFIEI